MRGIAYLDDLTIVGSTICEATVTANAVRDKLAEIGLSLNESKTKVISLKRVGKKIKKVSVDQTPILLGETQVKPMGREETFKLLGAEIGPVPIPIKKQWSDLIESLNSRLTRVLNLPLAVHNKLGLILSLIHI